MKLLQKTNRAHFLFSAILLLLAGILLYTMITAIIDEETTEKLAANKKRITDQLKQGKTVTQLPPVIEIEHLAASRSDTLIVKDTSLYDPVEEEVEFFREVTSIETINGMIYRITLRQVILHPQDYYNSFAVVLAIVLGLLLIGLLLINRQVSHSIWQPFYKNLDVLKSFSLQDARPIGLQQSDITEFEELNAAIRKLTDKVRSDYHALKEFTDNASHEMQTPLAIIQTKLEEALQEHGLSEQQAIHIKAAYSSAQRLSKLTQALLLLTRIENRQFTATENIFVAEAIETQLQQFQDFIQARNLSIGKELEASSVIKANSMLVATLLSNLISNAIKHNVEGGRITIWLKATSLTFSNTGNPLLVHPKELFERFRKANPSTESMGLGLAIVKRICETNGWEISYTTQGTWHALKINF